MNVLETRGLAKRYGRRWALRDCALSVPAGRVVALVGPNGAGKTTLFKLAAGLARPTAGEVTVLGGLRPGSAAARNRIAFVTQDAPLYSHLPVADMLHLARNLNLSWDQSRAEQRINSLGIPLGRKVGQLSGGQRAQLALTIAVARRPELMILDEPMASLDPLARHELLSSLMGAVAEDGMSVVFSSHVVSELERIADYLLVLNGGRLQLAGPVDTLLATHVMLTGPAGHDLPGGGQLTVVGNWRTPAQTRLLVRTSGAARLTLHGWLAEPASLEELVLAYLRDPAVTALPGPSAAPAALAGHGAEVSA